MGFSALFLDPITLSIKFKSVGFVEMLEEQLQKQHNLKQSLRCAREISFHVALCIHNAASY